MKLSFVVAAIFMLCVFSSTEAKKKRVLKTDAVFSADKFCPDSCNGACYYALTRASTFEYERGDRACHITLGGHLANIYNKECYYEIADELSSNKQFGEFLIGMTYEKKSGRNGITLYDREDIITNPQWYRRRPNRIGQENMVLIVGRKDLHSGLWNVLNDQSHQTVLCEVQGK